MGFTNSSNFTDMVFKHLMTIVGFTFPIIIERSNQDELEIEVKESYEIFYNLLKPYGDGLLHGGLRVIGCSSEASNGYVSLSHENTQLFEEQHSLPKLVSKLVKQGG